MLSAHEPYKNAPALIKAAAKENGGMASSLAACPRCVTV